MKRKYIIYSLLLFTFSFTECSKDEDDIDKLRGFSTIYSFINSDDNFNINEYSGFSFNEAGIITYPNYDDIIPDFILSYYDPELYFSMPSIYPYRFASFCLLNKFDNENSAKEYFESPSIILDSIDFTLSTHGYDFETNQIWLIKTKYLSYGIIRIISIDYYQIEDNGNTESNASLYFEWKYQPDGTLNF